MDEYTVTYTCCLSRDCTGEKPTFMKDCTYICTAASIEHARTRAYHMFNEDKLVVEFPIDVRLTEEHDPTSPPAGPGLRQAIEVVREREKEISRYLKLYREQNRDDASFRAHSQISELNGLLSHLTAKLEACDE